MASWRSKYSCIRQKLKKPRRKIACKPLSCGPWKTWSMVWTPEYHCKIIRLEAEAIARDKLNAQADDKNGTPVLAGNKRSWDGKRHQPAASTQAPLLGRLPNLFQCFNIFNTPKRGWTCPRNGAIASLYVYLCVCVCVCVCLCVYFGVRWIQKPMNVLGRPLAQVDGFPKIIEHRIWL